MTSQYLKPKDYRDLTKEEIDLMNRIKEKGSELLALQDELANRLNTDFEVKRLSTASHQTIIEYTIPTVSYSKLAQQNIEAWQKKQMATQLMSKD